MYTYTCMVYDLWCKYVNLIVFGGFRYGMEVDRERAWGGVEKSGDNKWLLFARVAAVAKERLYMAWCGN